MRAAVRRRNAPSWFIILTLLAAGGCDSKPGTTTAPAGADAAPPQTEILKNKAEAATPRSTPTKDVDSPKSDTVPIANLDDLEAAARETVKAAQDKAKAAPLDAAAVGALGTEYYGVGFTQAARECFALAAKLDRKSLRWTYYEGVLLEEAGETRNALRAYRRAAQIDPNYAALQARQGELLQATDLAAADIALARAEAANPKDPVIQYRRGLLAKRRRRSDAAERHLRKALDAAPEFAACRNALIALLRERQRNSDAERFERERPQTLNAPTLEDPLFAELTARVRSKIRAADEALALLQKGELVGAETVLQAALKNNPKDLQLRQSLGLVYAARNQFDRAIEQFRACLEIEPKDVSVRLHLARSQMESGRYDDSQKTLDEARTLDPNQMGVYTAQYELYLRQNRLDEAIGILRGLLEKHPDDTGIQYQVAATFARAGKLADSMQQLDALLERAPKHAQARYLLGAIHKAQGRKVEARAAWERTIADNPKYVDAYTGLADLASADKDYARVESVLRAGLTQLPDTAILLNGIALLYASCPEDQRRNGKQAVELAENVCRATNNRVPFFLDTLAAAYAEVGRFDEAVRTAEQAIDLATRAGDKKQAEAIAQHRALYEQRKPFRL